MLCNAPDDRHPASAAPPNLPPDACFYAGLEKIETLDTQGVARQKWRPKAVYHYVQDKQLTPDFVVDITPFFPKKMEAIFAFRSQFYDPNDEPNQPKRPSPARISLISCRPKPASFGRPIQAEFAEGFMFSRTPGVGDLFDLV